MATLDTYLSNTSEMCAATERIAKLSDAIQSGDVNLNDGIRTSKELITRADEGSRLNFDHARLLAEAAEYD